MRYFLENITSSNKAVVLVFFSSTIVVCETEPSTNGKEEATAGLSRDLFMLGESTHGYWRPFAASLGAYAATSPHVDRRQRLDRLGGREGGHRCSLECGSQMILCLVEAKQTSRESPGQCVDRERYETCGSEARLSGSVTSGALRSIAILA